MRVGFLNPTHLTNYSTETAVALEHNNTALEFETMLRQHLARGGAVVAACTGVDADGASAYLEGSLAGAARSGFEAHLAGCPTCRRYVIELSRLSQSLSPTPVTTTRGVWEQLHTTLATWFDPAGWRWQWAPAAAALFLAVLAVQMWQPRRQENATVATVTPNAVPGSQAPVGAPTPLVVTPASEENEQRAGAGIVAAVKEAHRREVPKPEIGAPHPLENLTALNLSAPGSAAQGATQLSSRMLNYQIPSEAPSAAHKQPVVLPAPPSAAGGGLAPLAVNDQVAFSFEQAGALAAAPQQPMIAARLAAPAEASPAGRGREKAKLQPASESWRSRVLGYMPLSKTEAERKPEASLPEISRAMIVRIHDKLFRFEQGVWIDQAYKPEMQWRVLKLVRGSREYEQVLAAEPQLKDFFARGSILILWKDKIYKVVGP